MIAIRLTFVVVIGASILLLAKVVADHALATQVVAASAGAVMTIGGVAAATTLWPSRDRSSQRQLGASFGFLVACVGVFTMLMAAGLFH